MSSHPPLPPGFTLDAPAPPADFGGALLSRAEKEYPYLSRSGLVAVTGKNGGKRKLEYWPAGEPGSASIPRPSGIPLGSAGVEVFDGSVSPKDLLADYVSHEAVNSDPELKRMYSEFAASVPDELMRERYEYHRKNFGEQRGYEAWKERSGMPEYFRGYTFDQWPNAKRMYSPEQLQKLDTVRGYLGIGGAADRGKASSMPPLPAGFTLDQQPSQPDAFAGDDLLSNESMSQLDVPSAPAPSAPSAPKPGGFMTPFAPLGHLLSGAAEAGTSLLTGAVAPIIASAKKIPEAFGNPDVAAPTNEEVAQHVYQPRGTVGQGLLSAAGKVIAPVANAMAETGADVALLPLGAEMQALDAIPRAPKPTKVRAPKTMPAKAPTAEELGTAAKEAYQRAKDAGAVAAPEGYARMTSGLRNTLREQGFNPRLHPKAAAVVDEVEKLSNGNPVSLDEIEILRRQALAAERSIEADERRIAGLVIDRLDDYADALASGAEPVMGGNAPAAVAARKEARNLYSRNRKSMEIQELIERAQIRASQFSGSGEENALRTEFRGLAMNPKRMRRFNKEEQQAIKEVAFGTPTSNTLRQIGKLAPTGGLMQALTLGAAVVEPLTLVATAAGAGSRFAATRMTRNAARRAEELMRRGPQRSTEVAQEAAVGSGNRIAQLAPADDAGQAFDAERAAAALASRDSFVVEEAPRSAVREITLETPPEQNRIASLAPQSVTAIEKEMREIKRRAMALPNDSPELLELDARFTALQEELQLAKSRGRRNRVSQLAGEQ